MPDSDKQENSNAENSDTRILSEGYSEISARLGESHFDIELPTRIESITSRSGESNFDSVPTPPLEPIERVRFRIAVGVLCGFFGLISVPTVAFLVAMFVTESVFGVDDFVRVVTTLSAATAGLAGAVVGYYFGQNSNA